jgi:hypothetical protein
MRTQLLSNLPPPAPSLSDRRPPEVIRQARLALTQRVLEAYAAVAAEETPESRRVLRLTKQILRNASAAAPPLSTFAVPPYEPHPIAAGTYAEIYMTLLVEDKVYRYPKRDHAGQNNIEAMNFLFLLRHIREIGEYCAIPPTNALILKDSPAPIVFSNPYAYNLHRVALRIGALLLPITGAAVEGPKFRADLMEQAACLVYAVRKAFEWCKLNYVLQADLSLANILISSAGKVVFCDLGCVTYLGPTKEAGEARPFPLTGHHWTWPAKWSTQAEKDARHVGVGIFHAVVPRLFNGKQAPTCADFVSKEVYEEVHLHQYNWLLHNLFGAHEFAQSAEDRPIIEAFVKEAIGTLAELEKHPPLALTAARKAIRNCYQTRITPLLQTDIGWVLLTVDALIEEFRTNAPYYPVGLLLAIGFCRSAYGPAVSVDNNFLHGDAWRSRYESLDKMDICTICAGVTLAHMQREWRQSYPGTGKAYNYEETNWVRFATFVPFPPKTIVPVIGTAFLGDDCWPTTFTMLHQPDSLLKVTARIPEAEKTHAQRQVEARGRYYQAALVNEMDALVSDNQITGHLISVGRHPQNRHFAKFVKCKDACHPIVASWLFSTPLEFDGGLPPEAGEAQAAIADILSKLRKRPR